MKKIPNFEEDMDIIGALGDVPGSDNNLSPAGLKAKFDRAGNLLKDFINTHIVPAINGYVADNSWMLPLDGGTMTGPIDMNGNKITNLPAPTAGGDAASKGYVDKAIGNSLGNSLVVCTAEIGTAWTESDGYCVQNVSVPGIRKTDIPVIDLIPRNGIIQTDEECENMALIRRIFTEDGFITVYAAEKTSAPITIQMIAHRAAGTGPSESGEYILYPGDGGAVEVKIGTQTYPMANTELGSAPSAANKYSFEIV